MSDRERSGPDDVEGHRRSYQDTEADETEATADDVEGHRRSYQDTEATDEAQMTTEDMERRKNY
jgi:hypothetical protein